MRWIKKLFRTKQKWFLHKHKWKTTHTNKWMIPNRQVCKCGLIRESDTTATDEPLMYCWRYSDGTYSKPMKLGDLE